jgi:ABC-type antimicrobial peptide transport system permease subunit
MARERSQETKAAALAALGAEKKHRQNMREELEGFAAWLIPLVLIGAIFSVGLLMLYNVRSRTTELGVLRAIGFQSNTLFGMLLSRAVLIGLLGAMLGYWIGVLAGVRLGIEEGGGASVALFASPLQWLMLTGATILLTMVAGLPPAIYALNEDPADILQKDF